MLIGLIGLAYIVISYTVKANVMSKIQIKRSQHALINPAITIVLRMGAGGNGVPPLGSPDG